MIHSKICKAAPYFVSTELTSHAERLIGVLDVKGGALGNLVGYLFYPAKTPSMQALFGETVCYPKLNNKNVKMNDS